MEGVYNCISKAINIDADRKEYTKLYDFVRKSFINGLKENEIFKVLFADLSLCGSYADNLKISKPDEFDLVVRLEFPFNDDVHIEEDTINKGNVYLNLCTVLHKIANQNPKKVEMLKFLRTITNDNGYLLQDKFQSWFEGCMIKYLTKIQCELVHEGEKVFLKYKKQGPAHTILVLSNKFTISIDFVPGFRFSKSVSISPSSHLIENNDKWEAIPKPIIGTQSNPSFRCSYTESERKLLIGRNQFKNTLRMMKKFRDMRPKLTNLKSYHIKTLFLWHNLENETFYWNNSNHSIMDEMFEILESALKNREIRFFWDEDVNLLKDLSIHQIDSMYHEVKNARKTLINRSNLEQIENIFLTKDEQDRMTPQLKQELQKSFWDIAKDVVDAATPYIPWALGIAAGAAALGYLFMRGNRQNTNN